MPGAGKGVFRKIVKKQGYPVVIMGDEVRAEVKKRNLKPTPTNLGIVMLDLRKIDGPSAIAKRCISKIKNMAGTIVFVDGIRSLFEVDEFKNHFSSFILLAIHASPRTRYNRLFRRKRSDDPANWETFMERDLRELEVGMGSVISLTDYMIINEGTIYHFKQKIMMVLREVLKPG
jgi:dephospho-CoA kinase